MIQGYLSWLCRVLCIFFISRPHWNKQTHGSPACFPWGLVEHSPFTKEKQKSRALIPLLSESSGLRGLRRGTQEPCVVPLSTQKTFKLLSPLSFKYKSKQRMKEYQLQLGLSYLFLWSCSTRHNLIQYLPNQTRTKQKFLSVLQLHLQVGAAALGVIMPFPVSSWVNFHKTWVRWRDVISLHKDEQWVTEIKLSDVSNSSAWFAPLSVALLIT